MGWYWYRRAWEKSDELIQSSWRLSQVVLLLATVLPLLLVVWQFRTKAPSPARMAPTVAIIRPPTTDVPLTGAGLRPHPLLPYSVIPGGVRDEQELRSAVDHDPVVALHYASFNLARVRVVHLDRDQAFYVSYRMGDHVYWTHRKLLLHKGETVLTDGQHEARTRCGNRLSAVPEAPTALKEPNRTALENPTPPELAELTPAPELPFTPTPGLPPPPAETPAGGVFVPPILPIFWGGGSPGVPLIPVVPPPPAKGIPEPGSLGLLAMGLMSVWLVCGRREFRARQILKK